MKIVIDPLDPDSVDNAIVALEEYQRKVKRLETELPKALANIGKEFATADYSISPMNIQPSGAVSYPKINVTVEQMSDGCLIRADGKDVCFVEFGSGVYFNGADSYLGTRPSNLVGIGQFGKGLGKYNLWAFGKRPDTTWTHGTPASNTLYYTTQAIRRRLVEATKRILSDDRH